ncbi:polysaccharide deacetylase family protein [Thioalkalicoccus limnaeus]|uniref:Polysaccharide deacetylase family protein n=1 Tax=Thioalkalicoccus limnaeus TaxID=120681 RepID=A0ABV4BBR4_9GAMM
MTMQESGQRLISVHDLMPETMGRVEQILMALDRRGSGPITLLVVPGLAWSRTQIRTLRAWEGIGHVLAGHGWRHRVDRIAGPAHWLHSRLISRRVAEHLALNEDEIADLITRCFAWFADTGLQPPQLYVPPAWAMGRIPRARLANLPFRYYELLTGVYDAAVDRFDRLPLLGYEADNAARARTLRLTNGLIRFLAGDRPIRLAIHPFDLDLRLANDLWRDVDRYGPARRVPELPPAQIRTARRQDQPLAAEPPSGWPGKGPTGLSKP